MRMMMHAVDSLPKEKFCFLALTGRSGSLYFVSRTGQMLSYMGLKPLMIQWKGLSTYQTKLQNIGFNCNGQPKTL